MKPRITISKISLSWILIILTLIAFGLRLYRLEATSLRGDEAFDSIYATLPILDIIEQNRFIQTYPPLYHTTLHFWLMIAGNSAFSIRWLMGVIPGTLVIPLTYQLAHLLFRRQKLSLLAAWLAVINPYLLWWSQDAHFYALLSMFAVGITVFALRVWHKPSSWLLLWLYIIITVLGFYTHYFTYFSWGAVNLIALWFTFNWSDKAGFVMSNQGLMLQKKWWLAQIIIVVLYSPWIYLSLWIVTTYIEPWIEFAPFVEILYRNLAAYSIHLGQREAWGIVAIGLAGVLFLIGALPVRPDRFRKPVRSEPRFLKTCQASIILQVMIFAPLFVLYIATYIRPLYDEKLTIFVVPLFLITLARGIDLIMSNSNYSLPSLVDPTPDPSPTRIREYDFPHHSPTRIGVEGEQLLSNKCMAVQFFGKIGLLTVAKPIGYLSLMLISGAMLLSNYHYFFNPDYAKSPDWHGLMNYVHTHAQADDLLIYNFPEPTIPYYNDDRLPIILLPSNDDLDQTQIVIETEKGIGGYRRVWFVPLVKSWWDTNADVLTWLNRHADRQEEKFFRDTHVILYLTPTTWQEKMISQPTLFAEGIRLHGFHVAETDLSSDDVVDLSLYWQAERVFDISYTVFTHVIRTDGQLYGQWDNLPVSGTYPMTEWAPGEMIVDKYEIPINTYAPAGNYRLLIGLYNPATGVRLPVLDAEDKPINDHVQLSVKITLQ